MAIYIIMGVAGCGKSSIGASLAETFAAPFYEGDDFHPAANISKMSAGLALNDNDRGPWIDALAVALNGAPRLSFASCSALTRAVRARLRASLTRPPVFIFLDATQAEILQRIEGRRDHFMKGNMLRSQFDALERPADAIVIDANRAFDAVLADAVARVREIECGARPI